MATQSTKTYLEFVNSTIDEAGADLATYAADGSDWYTNTDAMLGRFKKWVNRAWKAVQQEADDWHWLEEKAVVNIDPGIMFYSDTPLTIDTNASYAIDIMDVDGTVKVSGLEVTRTVPLTGIYTSSKNYGYVDVKYADYSPSNGHALDFGLKAGGEYFNTNSYLKAHLNFRSRKIAGTGAIKLPVESSHTSDWEPATTQAYVSSVKFVTYTAVSGTCTTSSVVEVPVRGKIVQAGSGDTFYAYQWFLYIYEGYDEFIAEYTKMNSLPSNTSYAMLLFDAAEVCGVNLLYKDAGAGYEVQGYGTSVAVEGLGITLKASGCIPDDLPLTTDGLLSFTEAANPLLADYVDTKDINSYVDGGFDVEFLQHARIRGAIPGAGSLAQEYLVFLRQPTFGLYDFKLQSGNNDTTLKTSRFADYPHTSCLFKWYGPSSDKQYVHGWKSFDWSEETGVDDFVENIRSIDASSFKLVLHETPAVTSELPLKYVEWDEFNKKYAAASTAPGVPKLVTEDNQGRWRFYPAPDRPYTVTFEYSREAQSLEGLDEVCKGLPAEYEDIVMWKALQYYGEYDEQPSVAFRGRNNYKTILNSIQTLLRPKFHFKPKRLY